MQIQNLPVSDIYSDSDFNCRGAVTPASVVDLAESIKNIGLQQPITVRKYNGPLNYKWVAVTGHRRLQAMRNLKSETIPAIVNENLSDTEAQRLNIIENIAREQLTFMQEARSVARLANLGYNQKQIAGMLNVSSGWVNVRLLAMLLPECIQEEIDAGVIKQSHINGLMEIPSEMGRIEAARKIRKIYDEGDKRKINITETTVSVETKQNLLQKRVRAPAEIFKMQELIGEKLGYNNLTRLLGWCAGTVTTEEIMMELFGETFVF